MSTWDYLRGQERNVWHKKMQELSDQEGCPLVTMSLAFECQRLETISKMPGSQEEGEDFLNNANPTHKSAALNLLYESVRVLELLQVYSVNVSRKEAERMHASGISSTEGNELQVSTFLVPQGIGGTIEDLCKLSHGVETSRLVNSWSCKYTCTIGNEYVYVRGIHPYLLLSFQLLTTRRDEIDWILFLILKFC